MGRQQRDLGHEVLHLVLALIQILLSLSQVGRQAELLVVDRLQLLFQFLQFVQMNLGEQIDLGAVG